MLILGLTFWNSEVIEFKATSAVITSVLIFIIEIFPLCVLRLCYEI